MAEHRVIVVGAGIGGLVSALLLCARGLDVTLLEAADGPGGKMRPARLADGAVLDTGPTVFTMRWVFDELLHEAGSSLQSLLPGLAPLQVLARHAWAADGSRLDLFADRARSADAIAAFASPAEGRRYLAFCDEAARVYRQLEGPHIRSSRPSFAQMVADLGPRGLGTLAGLGPLASLAGALARRFSDPRLQQLFGRYATYCGASPAAAPATLMLVAHVEQEGVWAVPGGMAALAQALAALVATRGGAIRYGARCVGIDAEGGRVSGVRLEGGERLAADSVVFNGDASALAQLLGPQESRAPRPVPARGRSLSAVTWALHARARGFELQRHNVFFDADYASEFEDIFRRRRLPRQGTVYVCAQDRADDTRSVPAGSERLLLLVNAPADGDNPGFTDAEIDACQDRCLTLLQRCGLRIAWDSSTPQLRRTPVDFHRLYPASGGALYGPATHGWMALFKRASAATRLPGLYLAGGSVHPGPGVPMAAMSGAAGGRHADGSPRFDAPVGAGAYLWWYVDALSDDGRHALTLIAFVGSVFSPYYRSAWKAGRAVAEDHCAINVALYSPGATRWAMTEHGARHVKRDARRFQVGASSLHWDGRALHIHVDERASPLPRKVRGTIRVTPQGPLSDFVATLDEHGRHRWGPIAPCARVELAMDAPALKWQGHAYLDSNEGDEPISEPFDTWDWMRAPLADGSTVVGYDVRLKGGTERLIGTRFWPDGRHAPVALPPRVTLERSGWHITRQVRGDTAGGAPVAVQRTLEDTPFYARSVVRTRIGGQDLTAMHETFDARRFAAPWVQTLLPFRMPRRC